jgi:hypothetical protein
MLEDFIVSPAIYYGRYVDRSIPRREETPAMRLGSAVHSLVFGGPDVICAPPVDRRTKAGAAAWREFEDASKGKIILTLDEFMTADRTAFVVRNHEIAKQYIEAATQREFVVTATHKNGMPIKAKIDAVSDYDNAVTILDLKTTRDPYPSSWPRNLWRYGYHRQAAWYLQFKQTANWLWIVVGTDATSECFVYAPDKHALDIGRSENEAAMMRLAECVRNGNWKHPQSSIICDAELPRWYVEQGLVNVCEW